MDYLSHSTTNKKIILSILAGLICFLLSPFGIVVKIGFINLNIPWSLLFPILISIVFGSKYGLLSGLSGGALYPFYIWTTNGLGNIGTVVLLFITFYLLGISNSKLEFINKIPEQIRIVCTLILIIILFTLYNSLFMNFLLSKNHIIFGSNYVTSFTENVIRMINIKNGFNLIAVTFIATTLIRINFIRAFLGMDKSFEAKANGFIFLFQLANILTVWVALNILGSIFLRGNEALSNSQISLVMFVFTISNFLATRLIFYFSEKHYIARNTIRKTEEKVKSISNNFKTGLIYQLIMMPDGSRKFTYLSDAVKKLYGISPEEGMKDAALIYRKVYESDIERLKKEEENALKNMSDFKSELRVINPDGTLRWVSLVSTPKKLEDGSVCWDGIEFDISEIKNTERKLIMANRKAEEASAAKSQFLANMSHEIRTPMNGIMGIGELLAETRLDDEQKTFVNDINISARNLLNIINDILDISKIESGKIGIEIKEFRIADLFGNVLSIISYSAYNKKIEIVSNIDKNIPEFLYSDYGKIRQVLLNLVNNAVKFSDGGNILVSAKKVNDLKDIFNIEFSVLDAGIGISEEIKNKLFQPFVQGDLSYTKKYQGTGLGLAISKRMVEILGGEINFETEFGKGSRFYFRLPIKKSDTIVQNIS